MPVALRADRNGDRGRLVPTGSFDLAHATAVAQAVEDIPSVLDGCRSIDVDLAHLDRIDGAGAVLLARFLDRLDADGAPHPRGGGSEPGGGAPDCPLSSRRVDGPRGRARAMSALARIGTAGAQLPVTLNDALDFIGRCAAAVPKAVATPALGRLALASARCSRRSGRTRSWSRAPPICWSASSSGCSASRSSAASARSPTFRSWWSSHSSGSSDRWSRPSSWPADRARVLRRRSRR